MSKKLLEIAAEIVQAQASLNRMSPEEIESTLARTYNALYKMQQAEAEGKGVAGERGADEVPVAEAAPPDPKASIQENKVVCLECGAEMRQLTANHLATHSMSPREYKKKWGFPLKQPLSARSLTKSRSKSAKKRGVPPELKEYQEMQRQKKMETLGESVSVTVPAEVEETTTVEQPEKKRETRRPQKRKAEQS